MEQGRREREEPVFAANIPFKVALFPPHTPTHPPPLPRRAMNTKQKMLKGSCGLGQRAAAAAGAAGSLHSSAPAQPHTHFLMSVRVNLLPVDTGVRGAQRRGDAVVFMSFLKNASNVFVFFLFSSKCPKNT